MKFMNVIKKFTSKNDMVEFRNTLIADAEKCLNEGDLEKYDAAIEDINTFDKEYDEYVKKQADIAALRGAVSVPNVLNNTSRDGIVAAIDNNSVVVNVENEYRRAFMNFVLKGETIPAELRNADAYTVTTDVSAAIPNNILDRIVEKLETTGKILSKVTKTFFKGGVTVPTSAVKPVATWTTERGTTDKQKKTLGSVTFSYYKLKCVVAVSLAVDTVTLEVFERTLGNNIAEAMTRALEKAIIAGTGSLNNQPKGILLESAPQGQNINIAKGKSITYKDLNDAEGALPSAYENAEWYMTKKTYFGQVSAMTDSAGQPIARTNIGIDGKPSHTILGRPVNFVSSEDMADFSTAFTADTVVAFIYRMEDYMLNVNLGVKVKHYEDDDTDDKLTKAVMLADGKSIDNNSLVTLTAKSA